MGLINWIFDIYQHSQIDRARTDAAQARADVAAIRASGGGVDTERLERALGELRQVDLEDGRADGQSPLPG